MIDRWFYTEEGQTRGPETFEHLLSLFSRRLDWQQVLVWRDGFDGWRRAGDVPEISSQISMPPPLPQEAHVAPPAFSPPPVADEQAEPVKTKPKKKRAALYTTFVVFAGIVGVVFGKEIGREVSKLVMGTPPKTEAEAIDQGFTNAENEMRPTLPKKLDDTTTLVAVSHNGYRMRYELVVDAGYANKLSSDFLALAKKEVAPKVCASTAKKSLEIGASYEYVYRDPNRYPLGSFVVVNSDCKDIAAAPVAPVSK